MWENADTFYAAYLIRDDTHMTSMKIVYISRPPTHLPIYVNIFVPPPGHGRPILNEPPPTPPNKLWNNNRTVPVNKWN